MATQKKDKNESQHPDDKSFDLHTQQRLLEFINNARVPEDLTVLPHDVQVIDEAAAHTGHIPHHVHPKRTLKLDVARALFDARNNHNLLHGLFDVATTGDETFAEGYRFAQDLRLRGSAVKIAGTPACPRPADPAGIMATVLPLTHGGPTPTGRITFLVDGVTAGPTVKLDDQGRACLSTGRQAAGEHKIQAVYTCGGGRSPTIRAPAPSSGIWWRKDRIRGVNLWVGPGSNGSSRSQCYCSYWH